MGSRLLVVRLRVRAAARRVGWLSKLGPVRDLGQAIDVRPLPAPDSAGAEQLTALDVAHPGQTSSVDVIGNAAAHSVTALSRRAHDAVSIHAEIVEFLDRVEARELGRQRFAGSPGQSLGFESQSREPNVSWLHDEADRVLGRAQADAAELVKQARGEAEHTLEWSRAQGAEIVRRSQRLAADRFRTVEHSDFTVDLERR